MGLTLSVMLFPGNTWLFVAMLVGSIVYFVNEWPFVVNHIFIDTFLSATIVIAAVVVLGGALFTSKANEVEPRDEIHDRFSPIATVLVILIYYVILVSKLNSGFFDPEVGCMFTMYANWQHERPILGTINQFVTPQFLFYTFMVIELVLPILLTFAKTRLLGLYIGVPFHFVLGLMWHWAFSSFILALYVLIATPAIIDLFQAVRDRVGQVVVDAAVWGIRAAIVVAALLPVLAIATGNYGVKGPFGFPVFYGMFVWLIWACFICSITMIAVLRYHVLQGAVSEGGSTLALSAKPGWLWGVIGLVVLNCLSPYVGFKTQNNSAMYSNMQTEGGRNNHFFMPIVRIFPFQDDLVEVIGSTDPAIAGLRTLQARYDWNKVPHKILVTYFEFRRAVSERTAPGLEIEYKRNGEIRTYRHGDPSNVDGDLAQPWPLLLRKVAYFRPVFQERPYCLH